MDPLEDSDKRKRLSCKEQHDRFVATTRELGCDKTDEAFEKAFSKIAPEKQPKVSRSQRNVSIRCGKEKHERGKHSASYMSRCPFGGVPARPAIDTR
jgi:hypothetical protein